MALQSQTRLKDQHYLPPPCCVARGILVTYQVSNQSPWQQDCLVLTSGSLGNSLQFPIFKMGAVTVPSSLGGPEV